MASRVTEITDPTDPRIAPYTSIRERDLTGRGERFIVEGRVTLGVQLARGRFPLESVFVAQSRLEALSEDRARVPPDVPIYTASQSVFDQIAGFAVHRGILACCHKSTPLNRNNFAHARLLVVAVGLSNHDNVGALFRNAAAFGADGVMLDDESCDPLYRKAIRVSAGTALWLPFHQGGSAQEILGDLEALGFASWALTPRQTAPSIWSEPVPQRLALMLGAEGPGLADDIIAASHGVRIPMAPGVDSLNIATAAAITLAAVTRTA
ncbi:MAG: RNA methyltransferase [Pseudomonadota bacterium]